MSCLSHKQKAHFARRASAAFHFQAALARGRGETPDLSYKAIEEFRHAEVIKATGKMGLRCCSQDDYGALEAHFLSLVRQEGKALNVLVHDAGNKRRVAEWKIINLSKEMGLPTTYAAAICRQMFHGLNILDASEKQLWKIFYALNKQNQKRERTQAA